MKKQIRDRLFYRHPAPAVDDFCPYLMERRGWERYSLPIGNGFLGATVFGRLETERIQVTENSMFNPYCFPKDKRVHMCAGGLNNLAEILIDVNHALATDYERSLELESGEARVVYRYEGVRYRRTAFLSYPDRVLVMRFEADAPGMITLTVHPEIPFVRDYNEAVGDGCGKTGEVTEQDDRTLLLRGVMEYFDIHYEAQLRAIPQGGSVFSSHGRLYVEGADALTLIFAAGTNYRLAPSVFMEKDPKKKLAGFPDPHDTVTSQLNAACEKSYEELYRRHTEDFGALYHRVRLRLGGEADAAVPTDELLHRYQEGRESRYLEALLYQYGRYLLISSSRPGGLPANLQGIWNCYASAPWSSGYWHNVNIQMNYWPSCIAGLPELFLPYADYAKAYMPQAKAFGDAYVAKYNPQNLSAPGENGWTIGTGAWPYQISNTLNLSHSGPGTGAFTSLLFWDYYDYTRDEAFLRDFGYAALRDMSVFFSKALCEINGKFLIKDSASPEQRGPDGNHYHTTGCAFDQQMVYENYKRTLQAAEILGIEEPILDVIRSQIDRLDPVLIGDSGQVKEYREEHFYGEIGDPKHRHISHLVGLYPGTLISETTPEWMAAARVTLQGRGDKSTGWAAAHRLCLWTRAKCPERAMGMVRSMLKNNILENLWDTHPPFQIDGNFGYTAGVSEMLLQSQAGYLDPLAALPAEWSDGQVSGICARGGFCADLTWKSGRLTGMHIVSRAGGELRVRTDEPVQVRVNGKRRTGLWEDGFVSLQTAPGDTVDIKAKD